jgi:membrane protein required for colicin V production
MTPVNLHTLDLVILVVLAFGLVRGFTTGVIRQIASLIGLVAAFLVGVRFMQAGGEMLTTSLGLAEGVSPLLAFVLLFAAVQLILLGVVRFVEGVIGFLQLSAVNRVLGGLIGAGKVALLLSLVLLALNFFGLPGDETRKASLFYDPVASALPTTWEAVETHVRNAEAVTEPFTRHLQDELTEARPVPE